MKYFLKRLILSLSPILDILAAPLALVGALFFKVIRKYGVARLNLTRRIFWAVGIIPVSDHYYDPFFRKGDLVTLSQIFEGFGKGEVVVFHHET